MDAKKANELGVSNAEQYLINDLNNPINTKNKYVGVVDYFTGNVELLSYTDVTYKQTFDDVAKEEAGCTHDGTVTVASCTEPAVCTKCGKIISAALGHSFDREHATCTEDSKCIRCGYIQEKALGHEYTSTWSWDDTGHFNKCVRYDECHSKGNFQAHQKQYGMKPDNADGSIVWRHTVTCKDANCNWTKEEDCELSFRSINANGHARYCKNCLKEQEMPHDVIKYKGYDDKKHILYCATCQGDLYDEEHLDVEEPYGICDKCGETANTANAPVLTTVTMENITEGVEEKYWAKAGETIRITIETSVILSDKPTIKLQGKVVNSDSITPVSIQKYTVDIKVDDYKFQEGLIDISIENIRSAWGVTGENVYKTTDEEYVYYDSIPPEYIFIPE